MKKLIQFCMVLLISLLAVGCGSNEMEDIERKLEKAGYIPKGATEDYITLKKQGNDKVEASISKSDGKIKYFSVIFNRKSKTENATIIYDFEEKNFAGSNENCTYFYNERSEYDGRLFTCKESDYDQLDEIKDDFENEFEEVDLSMDEILKWAEWYIEENK